MGETETSKVLKLDQANGDEEEEENKAEKANNLNIEVSQSSLGSSLLVRSPSFDVIQY